MLCSKIHCQKGFKLIIVSYEIQGRQQSRATLNREGVLRSENCYRHARLSLGGGGVRKPANSIHATNKARADYNAPLSSEHGTCKTAKARF